MWFVLGEEVRRFHNILGDRPTKWPIAKKRNSKTFVIWDALLSIKLIDINHNKYLNSCKSLGQKLWWAKLGIKSSTQTMRPSKVSIQDIPWNSTTIVQVLDTYTNNPHRNFSYTSSNLFYNSKSAKFSIHIPNKLHRFFPTF